MKKTVVIVSVTLFCIRAWCATGDVVVPTTSDATKGAWMGTFSVATNFAFSNGIPLVMVWSKAECHFCNDLKSGFLKPAFQSWLKNSKFAYCLVEGTKTAKDYGANAGSGAKEFAVTAGGNCRSLTGTPCISLVWREADDVVKAVNFEGRNAQMLSKSGSLEKQFMDSVDGFFADYVETESSEFDCGDTVGDRLEAEAWTTSVNVPLVRKGLAAAKDAHETLAVLLPNRTEVERKTVIWTAGQSAQFVSVETASRYVQGQALTIVLYDGKGKKSAERPIAFVARENSPKNPTWEGVTDFGEWTMDLPAAQGLAGRAYTLALVGGSMWCPDCAKTDAYFVDTPEFRAWTLEKKVACVAIDIPNWSATSPTTGPCLLTREVKEVSEAYIAADPEHGVKQSGTGYLSRWEISDETALKKLEENRKLAGTSTLEGGWNRPERANQHRTGVPIFVLLNGDGSIAGRFEDFASASPASTNSAPAYIDRMDDLLATAGGREDCLSWMTATTVDCQLPASGGSVSSSVSAVRRTNWWKLTGVTSWLHGTFTLKGARESGPSGATNAVLRIWRKVGETVMETSVVRGNLFDGLELSDEAIDTSAEWFVQVEALESSEAFSVEHEGSSWVDYTLTATSVADPGTAAFSVSGATVKEDDVKKAGGVLEVRAPVERLGGASGDLTADVEIDEASTAEPDRYGLVDKTVCWGDGDRLTKGVRIRIYDDENADGAQDLILKIGKTHFVLTIVDNDKTAAGKISISEANPSIGSSRTVIAPEGSVVTVGVSRVSGASGRATATLTADTGAFDDDSELVWENRQSATVYRALRLPMLADAPKSGKVTVKLEGVTGAKVNASAKNLKVQLVASDAPRFAQERINLQLTRYVAAKAEVGLLNVDGATKVQVKKISGSLPSGLKASVDGNRFVITKAPTCKAKNYSAVYRVSATKNRKTVQGLTLCVSCSVSDFTELSPTDPGANPFVAKSRTLSDLMVLEEDVSALAGNLRSLSVNSRGKLSAKYVCRAGTISLSCDSWSSYDPKTGDLSAHLTAKKTAHALDVRVSGGRDGKIAVDVRDPALSSVARALVPDAWDPQENPADGWKGCYTVDFFNPVVTSGSSEVAAMGDAMATLKMSSSSDVKKGRMKIAGVLPNGKGFSASANLYRTGVDTVALPVFCLVSKDVFFAAPQIDRNWPAQKTVVDWASVRPRWAHTESKSQYGGYEIAYQTAGSAYDSKLDLEQMALAVGGSTQRIFEAGGWIESVPVTIKPTKPVADAALAKACSLRLNFTRSSGMISGSFKFTDGDKTVRTATYKGVVLPDWDGCPTCEGRPWAAGAFWYSDKIQFEDGVRPLSVTVGDQVIIELAQ